MIQWKLQVQKRGLVFVGIFRLRNGDKVYDDSFEGTDKKLMEKWFDECRKKVDSMGGKKPKASKEDSKIPF